MIEDDIVNRELGLRKGFEVCLCPAKHPEPLIFDRHHLWPLGWGGPNISANLAHGCPNVHRLGHTLLNLMKANHGPLTAREALHFGRYAKLIAETGWELMTAALPLSAITMLDDLRQ